MRVAFAASEDTLEAALDHRFGRAAKFIVYDTDTGVFEAVDNVQNVNAAQGAGIQAAQTVSQTGAECLVARHCGPKAFRVLSAAGITVYNTDAPTVAAALEAFQAGRLEPATSGDVEGHWV
ncbi:MAG: NifB/NifX family molybdenum-iron cluster-binding protein [Sedimentisphaerales bacterium]|nr:NifB/NifX family molybdenum-iron cluster-binding protein [Sedimentisphaerales bacterium]